MSTPSPTAGTAARPTHRELTRQYKQTLRPMGVYVIRNLVDDRIVIHASLDLDGAMNRDRFDLKLDSHRNKRLLEDWRRLGAANFRFEIVDTIKPRDDPAFDYKAELEAMRTLWTAELDPRGDRQYAAVPR